MNVNLPELFVAPDAINVDLSSLYKANSAPCNAFPSEPLLVISNPPLILTLVTLAVTTWPSEVNSKGVKVESKT